MDIEIYEVPEIKGFNTLSAEEQKLLLKDADSFELKKCDHCGKLIRDEYYKCGDEDYCSSECMEEAGEAVPYLIEAYGCEFPDDEELQLLKDIYGGQGWETMNSYFKVRSILERKDSTDPEDYDSDSYYWTEVQLRSKKETIDRLNKEVCGCGQTL